MRALISKQLARSFTLGQCLGWWGVTLTIVVLGAHFLRAGNYSLTLCVMGVLFFHCSQSAWKNYSVAFFLLWGVVEWGQTASFLILMRSKLGVPWFRGAAIIISVAFISSLSAIYVYKQAANKNKVISEDWPRFKAVAFISVFLFLLFIQSKAATPLLLLERYFPLWGGVQIFLAAWYAAVVADYLIDAKKSRKMRRKIWLVFSVIFFGQLFLGLMGFDKLLMTGKLHLPVPGFIILGPVYRGELSIMMPILAVFSVLLTGTAWCSFLCYFGSFDAESAGSRPISRTLPYWLTSWLKFGRPGILIIGVILALLLRTFAAPVNVVAGSVVLYVVASIVFIGILSKKFGGMVHCISFCPMGLFISVLGRLSFWRIKVDKEKCDDCGTCEKTCQYRAITLDSRQKGKTLMRCSTCRDCLAGCSRKAIYLSHPLIPQPMQQPVFVLLVTVLHVVFLSVARV